MKNRKGLNHKGFTLAELLIVVTIIAVLVAIAIPLFTSQLKKARAATCMSNRDSIKRQIAADMISDNSKTAGDLLKKYYDKTKDHPCPEGGEYSISETKDSLGFDVECSKHRSTPSFGDNNVISSIVNIMRTSNKNYSGALDSGGASVDGSYVSVVVEGLKSAGFDLEKMNAESWAYRPSGSSGFLYWTDKDISKLSEGSKVATIRYNGNTGTYTIWIATVQTQNKNIGNNNTKGTYNYFSSFTEYKPSTGNLDKQTYSDAVELMKQAQVSDVQE